MDLQVTKQIKMKFINIEIFKVLLLLFKDFSMFIHVKSESLLCWFGNLPLRCLGKFIIVAS